MLVREHSSAGISAEELMCDPCPVPLWSRCWVVWKRWTRCLEQISCVDNDHFYLCLSIGPLPSTPSTPLPDTTTRPPHTPPPTSPGLSSGTAGFGVFFLSSSTPIVDTWWICIGWLLFALCRYPEKQRHTLRAILFLRAGWGTCLSGV